MDGPSLTDQPPLGDNSEDEFFPDISGRDPARSILEAASWRLTAELVRRYPDRFSVIETHPGGGQYDCITLIDEDNDSIYRRSNSTGLAASGYTAATTASGRGETAGRSWSQRTTSGPSWIGCVHRLACLRSASLLPIACPGPRARSSRTA